MEGLYYFQINIEKTLVYATTFQLSLLRVWIIHFILGDAKPNMEFFSFFFCLVMQHSDIENDVDADISPLVAWKIGAGWGTRLFRDYVLAIRCLTCNCNQTYPKTEQNWTNLELHEWEQDVLIKESSLSRDLHLPKQNYS